MSAEEKAQAKAQHEEELGVLSEKLRQLLHERAELESRCMQHESDVSVLSQEIVRLRAGQVPSQTQ